MLMLNPELILAAIEKSERLGQLNRQLCRPLDRPAPTGPSGTPGAVRADNDDDAADNDFS
ncbi:MAG TPA: hypothetical protein VEZ89_03025 [Rubrivivax sp.]|nr:hypothetical protein [Rubrivivax sp.]